MVSLGLRGCFVLRQIKVCILVVVVVDSMQNCECRELAFCGMLADKQMTIFARTFIAGSNERLVAIRLGSSVIRASCYCTWSRA